MIKLTAVALLALAGSPLAMPMTPAAAQPDVPHCDIVAGFRATCVDGDGTVYVMPQIPDDDLKILGLKLGYQINGNSMVGRGESIDLTPRAEAPPRYRPVDAIKDAIKPRAK